MQGQTVELLQLNYSDGYTQRDLWRVQAGATVYIVTLIYSTDTERDALIPGDGCLMTDSGIEWQPFLVPVN